MAKRKSNPTTRGVQVMRSGARREYVEALRDGRKERASTYADRRKVADKRACRGSHRDW